MSELGGQTIEAGGIRGQRRMLAGWLSALSLLGACGTAAAAAPTPTCDAPLDGFTRRVQRRLDVTSATLTLPEFDGRLDCANAGGHPCDPGSPPAAFRLAWDPRGVGACLAGHEFAVQLRDDESLASARIRLASALRKAGGKSRLVQITFARTVERVNDVNASGDTNCKTTPSERIVVTVPGLGIGPFVSDVRGEAGYSPGTCQ